MARVLPVRSFSARSTSRQKVSSRISHSTGVAPAIITALAVATNVRFGTITSSPGPMPNAFRHTNRAMLPLHIVMACLHFARRAVMLSNSRVKSCSMRKVESITRLSSRSSPSSTQGSIWTTDELRNDLGTGVLLAIRLDREGRKPPATRQFPQRPLLSGGYVDHGQVFD